MSQPNATDGRSLPWDFRKLVQNLLRYVALRQWPQAPPEGKLLLGSDAPFALQFILFCKSSAESGKYVYFWVRPRRYRMWYIVSLKRVNVNTVEKLLKPTRNFPFLLMRRVMIPAHIPKKSHYLRDGPYYLEIFLYISFSIAFVSWFLPPAYFLGFLFINCWLSPTSNVPSSSALNGAFLIVKFNYELQLLIMLNFYF